MFDFFGMAGRHPQQDENANDDDSRRPSAQDNVQLAPPRAGRGSDDPQDRGGKSQLVRQQQRRPVIVDQAPAPAASDDGEGRWGGGLFGRRDWHRDEPRDRGWHRDWNDDRNDDGW
jgi:hypothetical protein